MDCLAVASNHSFSQPTAALRPPHQIVNLSANKALGLLRLMNGLRPILAIKPSTLNDVLGPERSLPPYSGRRRLVLVTLYYLNHASLIVANMLRSPKSKTFSKASSCVSYSCSLTSSSCPFTSATCHTWYTVFFRMSV